MNKLPTCCEFHHKTECGQSDFCPARAAKHEGVMTMPTGCGLKAAPRPATPAAHTGGHVAHLVKWLAISAFFASALATVAGFFNH